MLCCHARCVLHAMFNKPASLPSEYRHPWNGFPIMTTSSPDVLFLWVCVCVHVSEVAKWLNGTWQSDRKSAPVNSLHVCVVSTHTLDCCQKGAHRKCFSLSLSSILPHKLCVHVKVCVCLPPMECTDMPPWFLQTTGAERNHLSVQKPTHTHTNTHFTQHYHIHIYSWSVHSTMGCLMG